MIRQLMPDNDAATLTNVQLHFDGYWLTVIIGAMP
ncbi:hypothetical protein MMC2321_01472 [Chitinophaga sp. MM2321]